MLSRELFSEIIDEVSNNIVVCAPPCMSSIKLRQLERLGKQRSQGLVGVAARSRQLLDDLGTWKTYGHEPLDGGLGESGLLGRWMSGSRCGMTCGGCWCCRTYNTTYSFNHNCQTAGAHRIKQYLGIAIQKLINIIVQHYNGKISQLIERYSRKVISRNNATDKQDRHIRIRWLVGPQDVDSLKMNMQWHSYSFISTATVDKQETLR